MACATASVKAARIAVGKLDYDITITDPMMLAKPWSWGGTFFATSGSIKRWSCGADRG